MACGFIGIVTLGVRLPHAATLKDRRSALAVMRTALERRFGASVAEVGDGQLTAAIVQRSTAEWDRRVAELEAWVDGLEPPVAIGQFRVVTPEDLA
jgi:uncharacterized protein YlxP (DUF503 family)